MDGEIEAAKVRMLENGLAALTFAKNTLAGEPLDAGERVRPIMRGYSMDEIHEGALYALTVLLGYEAAIKRIPVEQHVEDIRKVFLNVPR